MFFGDPVAAFTNIRRGMAPGARLALDRVAGTRPERVVRRGPRRRRRRVARSRRRRRVRRVPFGLSDADATRVVLETAGFEGVVVRRASPRRTGWAPMPTTRSSSPATSTWSARSWRSSTPTSKARALDALRDDDGGARHRERCGPRLPDLGGHRAPLDCGDGIGEPAPHARAVRDGDLALLRRLPRRGVRVARRTAGAGHERRNR